MRHHGPFDHRFQPNGFRHGHFWSSHRKSSVSESDEHIDDSGGWVGGSHGHDDHSDIPAWRQALHVVGLVLMGIGFLLFFSVFLSKVGLFSSSRSGFSPGSFSSFERQMNSDFLRAVIGILLVAAGGGLRAIAAAGLAGSGLILSPKQARHDLRPWAKMAGGLIDDAAKEVDAIRGLTSARNRTAEQTAGQAAGQDATASSGLTAQSTVVKIRCQKCKTLNDEDAKYCDHCGSSL